MTPNVARAPEYILLWLIMLCLFDWTLLGRYSHAECYGCGSGGINCVRFLSVDSKFRDTRCARLATLEMDCLKGFVTRGSPRGLGQPRANILDTFSVVMM